MGLYPEKTIGKSRVLQTIDELIPELNFLKTAGINNIDVLVKDTEGNFISIDDAVVSLELIEKRYPMAVKSMI